MTIIAVHAQLQSDIRTELSTAFPDIDWRPYDDENWQTVLPDADALISWQCSLEQLELSRRLRWMQTVGAGVDGFPLQAIAARHITLTNSSGVHATNISEHVLAMMLSFSRNLPLFRRAQTRHEWLDNEGESGVFELTNQQLLIVGTGKIGSLLASRAKAFGMHVSGVRRANTQTDVAHFDHLWEATSLIESLTSADHVVIALPLTTETSGLFSSAAFAAMKPGSYFYNIGRGKIVDTNALVAALQSGHLAGAGLDVTEPEPLPVNHPLWDHPRVILTPHVSGATPYYATRLIKIVSENIRRFQANQNPLLNEVDLQSGY